MSDAERALYREHGELASRMCLHGLTEAEASRLEAVRSALDEIEMRKMGPVLERLQARADATGELRDKVLALVAETGAMHVRLRRARSAAEVGGVMTCRNTTGIADPDLCSKRCTDHPFTHPCDACGEPVEGVTYGGMDVIGAVHSGCFGFPLCSCATPHHGDCE